MSEYRLKLAHSSTESVGDLAYIRAVLGYVFETYYWDPSDLDDGDALVWRTEEQSRDDDGKRAIGRITVKKSPL